MRNIIGKFSIYILVGLLAATVYLVFFYKPCQEPTTAQVQSIQFNCAVAMIGDPNLKVEACREIKHQDNCVFDVSADTDAINTFLINRANACAKKALIESNFCTDKVEELK